MKFKIKLAGKNEFEAFSVIVQLALRTCETGTLPDLLQFQSMERLALKLITIATQQRQFKKLSIALDEAQTAMLYYTLTDGALPLGAYEQNLAYRMVDALDRQYHNAVALRQSLIQQGNMYNVLAGGNKQLTQ